MKFLKIAFALVLLINLSGCSPAETGTDEFGTGRNRAQKSQDMLDNKSIDSLPGDKDGQHSSMDDMRKSDSAYRWNHRSVLEGSKGDAIRDSGKSITK